MGTSTGLPFAFETTADGSPALRKAKVTQCALSRICGYCGESLGRPIAFAGSHEDAEANAFHLPPMHVTCAQSTVQEHGEQWQMLGQDHPVASWVIVTTAGFEFVRAQKGAEDTRPVFVPNAVIGQLPVLHH